MHSIKNTHKDSIQLIADILSFENPHETLVTKLSQNTIDWEEFVTTASHHLVLTTVYCRLKQKHLLEYLPEDLSSYLDEITTINRNRNFSILKQIQHISTLFNTNTIDYTFLKGSALLIGNYFEDLGERMIGDIDILVHENDIEKAYHLLLEQGYQSIEQTLGASYFEHKHLPRLTTNNFISAVEVHKKVLIKPYKGMLFSKDILKEKQLKAHTFIPSNNHLAAHCILNHQINDSGHYYTSMSLRSIYDTILLLHTHKLIDKTYLSLGYVKSYFSLATLFFSDVKHLKYNRYRSRLFVLKLNYPKIGNIINFFLKKLSLMLVIINRSGVFIRNKSYRNAILMDYKRIFSLLKSKF